MCRVLGQPIQVQFWWVNHKQTVRQEIAGGYLWSPKQTAAGARNQFYENMRRAAPGDVVLSFANGQVGHVGIVTGVAMEEGKPSAFGSVGSYWSDNGWWLPVDWRRLEAPLIPQAWITEIRDLLPTRYSPINATSGWGNQGAYLAEISAGLFEFVIVRSQGEKWNERLITNSIQEQADSVAESQAAYDQPLNESERQQVVKARRGQGLFRFRVSHLEPACRLTGINNPALLLASHIKPWRDCASTHERLDGTNGLMLTPDVDHLFDKGLISFSDSGDILQSKWLVQDELRRLGLEEACHRNVGGFLPQQLQYMDYHRSEVFDRRPT